MSKGRMGALFIASVFMIALGFNNCSKVDFEKVDPSGAAVSQTAGPGEPLVQPILEEEIDAIVDNLPEDKIDIIRPVTDLENDPTLYDLYKCGDGGVLICHFPDNVQSQGSMCIGRPAVSSHYDHLRSYVMDGVNKEISDYLGPCRVAL